MSSGLCVSFSSSSFNPFPFSKLNTCPISVSGDLTFYFLEKCELSTENAFSFLLLCIKMFLYLQLLFHLSPLSQRKTYTSFLLRLPPLPQSYPFSNFFSDSVHQLLPLTSILNLPLSMVLSLSLRTLPSPHPKEECTSLNPTTPWNYNPASS